MSDSSLKQTLLLDDFQNTEKSVTRNIRESLSNRALGLGWIASKLQISLQILQSSLKLFFLDFLSSLIPSFFRPVDLTSKPVKLHPTAYLDGIRGVAAFFVFIHHFVLDWYPFLSNGYGSIPHEKSIAQLPFIRIIYSGKGMVTTFFIISGYVLSYKTLGLSHAGRYSTVLDSLSSSVFRRGLRLFLPTAASTFISLLLSRLNLFRQDLAKQNLIPQRQPSLFAELGVWLKYSIAIADPFQTLGGATALFGHPYDGHLWTLPVEYHGSFIVFVTILCLSKVRPNIRLFVLVVLVLYTLHQAHWEASLFLCGTLFADLSFFAASRSDLPSNQPADIIDILSSSLALLSPRVLSILRRFAITSAFTLGIYLLCYPDGRASETPGYALLSTSLTPSAYHAIHKEQKFSLTLGAMLLVGSIIASPSLQRPFTTSPVQYLAKTSYALYMAHGPVLYTGGMILCLAANTDLATAKQIASGLPEPESKRMLSAAWRAYASRFAVAACFNFIVVIWAADWLWRVVDMRAVKFARFVSDWCWVKE